VTKSQEIMARFGLEVLQRFPVHERVRKTVLLLRGSLSISLVEVPVLSTSPHMAKSLAGPDPAID
jgi:hypothetical protein